MKFIASIVAGLTLAWASPAVWAQENDQGPEGATVVIKSQPVEPAAGLTPAPKVEPVQKWVHTFANFASPKQSAGVEAVLRQAKAAGYTALLVSDTKWHKLQLTDERYKKNLQAFRKTCKDQGIKFVVGGIGPFGYADTFLSHNPNLAESQPVRGAAFIVRDGKLVPFDDGTTVLRNGSFEELDGDKPAGWQGDKVIIDKTQKADGAVSIALDFGAGGGEIRRRRISQDVKVKPWQYYLLSAKVKVENFSGKEVQMHVVSKTRPGYWLNMEQIEVAKATEWKTVYAAFCSQDSTEVTVNVGVWEAKKGKIWWDDVKIQPGGFINIVRRDDVPLTVTSEDGKTVYTEGKDFAQVADPKLVNDPVPGYFKVGHEQPDVTIPAGSALKEGQKVLASYCFAIESGKAGQMNVSLAEPEVYQYIEEEARWMKENVAPDMYFMGYDEVRAAGWDDAEVKTGKTPGQLLAESVAKTIAIIKKVDPGKPISVWNDMFDPNHNASPKFPQYYMVKGKGPWAGSWEGLSRDVLIVNWLGKQPESVVFFAQRGHQQIISDQDTARITSRLGAAEKLPGIVGVMYTNWSNDFSKLKVYSEAVDGWWSKHKGR